MISPPRLVHSAGSGASIAAGEVLCCLPVRNEILRLASVLDHHRRLGVDRFIVVDNGSVDGTVDFLAAQADVRLYSADGSFSESHFGFHWLHQLLDEFACGHWVLTIDGDECFTYPHYEQVDLRQFCSFLDGEKAGAVFSILLDMYSDRILADAKAPPPGVSLIESCPYFDPGPYQVVRSSRFPGLELRGGPRARVFWDSDTPFFPPTVSKVPLVKWQRGYRYVSSTHYMQPAPTNLSAVTGALLHFKFLADFHQRAKLEAERGEHFNGAREYKLYLRRLEQHPLLKLHFSGSVRYEGSKQLLGLQLLRTSQAWEDFARVDAPA